MLPFFNRSSRIFMLLIVVISVVGAFLLLQVVLAYFISPAIGKWIVDNASKELKTKVSIEKVNVWPLTLSASFKGIKIFDPDNADKKIITVDDASLHISLLALLSKKVVIEGLNINGFGLLIESIPSGGFNIERLIPGYSSAKDITYKSDIFGPDVGGRDWIGRLQKIIKARNEPVLSNPDNTAVEPAQTEKYSKQNGADPKASKSLYSVWIKNISIKNAVINLRTEKGEGFDIAQGRLKAEDIIYTPDKGIDLGLFNIRSPLKKDNADIGALNFGYKKINQKIEINILLKDADLAYTGFIYDKSIPVIVERGNLTLSCDGGILNGNIDSRVSIVLKDHLISAKDPDETAFGIVSMGKLCDVINSIEPFELEFEVGGTIKKPQFTGFQDSLMKLVMPYLKNLLIEKGLEALKGVISKDSEGAATDSGKEKAINAAVDALKSIFGDKEEK